MQSDGGVCMPKSSLEKALEKYQKETAKNVRKQIQADKRLADKQRRETNRLAQIDVRIERAASIVNGQPIVGGLKIIDSTAEYLASIVCGGYKREDYKVTNNDLELPEYLERDLPFEFEKLKQYGLISQYDCYVSGDWEISILPSILSYFQDKEKAMNQEQKTNSYTNNFYGDVLDIQIQQGTKNSTQTKSVNNGFDYEAVGKIIEQIRKYDGMLDSEFGNSAIELREKMEEISSLVQKRDNPGKIQALLGDIKNLAIGVGESLISAGILSLLKSYGVMGR